MPVTSKFYCISVYEIAYERKQLFYHQNWSPAKIDKSILSQSNKNVDAFEGLRNYA